MNVTQIIQLLNRLRSRTGLMIVVGVLVVLNLGRLGIREYDDILAGIDSKQALLGQYQVATNNLDNLRQEIKRLEVRQGQFDTRLFTGKTRNEITSAMQIKLQDILGAADLTPESLRSSNGARKVDDKAYGEVLIKIRLTGKLDNFLQFLSKFYKMNYFFKIENFTLKPFKKDQLKVFLGLKGFYRLTGGPQHSGAAQGTKARR